MASACCSCVVVVHEKRCFNGSQLKLIYLSHLLEIQIYASFILLLIEKLMRSYSYTCHHATKSMKNHKKLEVLLLDGMTQLQTDCFDLWAVLIDP